jgi:hypothetical protein
MPGSWFPKRTVPRHTNALPLPETDPMRPSNPSLTGALLLALLVLGASLALGACGQKGDLRLPDDPPAERR